jgi:hypothetical protein
VVEYRPLLFGLLDAFHTKRLAKRNKELGCAVGFYQSHAFSRREEKAPRGDASLASPTQTEEV